jgi:hypothetical protein
LKRRVRWTGTEHCRNLFLPTCRFIVSTSIAPPEDKEVLSRTSLETSRAFRTQHTTSIGVNVDCSKRKRTPWDFKLEVKRRRPALQVSRKVLLEEERGAHLDRPMPKSILPTRVLLHPRRGPQQQARRNDMSLPVLNNLQGLRLHRVPDLRCPHRSLHVGLGKIEVVRIDSLLLRGLKNTSCSRLLRIRCVTIFLVVDLGGRWIGMC